MTATVTPPTLPGRFLLGSAPEFQRDTLHLLLESRKLGEFVRMYYGPFRLYILNTPDLAHEVLVEKAASFYKTTLLKTVLEPVVGAGLFTNDGDSWRQQRRLAQPAFHSKRIAAYADVMVQFAHELAERWHDQQTLDVEHEMAGVTMQIVSKTLFDAHVTQEDTTGQAVATVLRLADQRFNRIVQVPDWLPTPENRRMKAAIQHLDALIQGFINERRATGEDKGDLLSMMIAATDDENGARMSDKQLRDEVMTVFGAGHETTAVTLTWAFYVLSQHPEVEAKLHAELDTVLGGRLPTFEDLPKLTYTEKVIKETMRLYPPAWSVTREPIVPVRLADKYDLKKGETLMVNIYGIHRDERYFPDPLRFDPERWTPENEKKMHRYQYFPFGAGPRVCIGNSFAMMEARLVLATLAQRFRLTLAPEQIVKPQRVFTLRPRYGMKMIAHVRQPIPQPVI
ncbi:MAG: cytochrome P450 [Anaerolineae bacterium]